MIVHCGVMTTFAFDGRLVAADTQTNSGDTKLLSSTTKIHPLVWTDKDGVKRRRVYALTGLLAPFPILARWHMSGASPDTYPTFTQSPEDGFDFIVIDVDEGVGAQSVRVFSTEAQGHAMTNSVPFASGSGELCARTAFYLGYDAATAARCGAELDSGSGLPIEIFDVVLWKWIRRKKPVPGFAKDISKACRAGLAIAKQSEE